MTRGPELQSRLAHGHNSGLEAIANWDMDVLAGAGGFRSTVNDLLRFLAAELGYADSGLKAAMTAQLVPRRIDASAESINPGSSVRARPLARKLGQRGGAGVGWARRRERVVLQFVVDRFEEAAERSAARRRDATEPGAAKLAIMVEHGGDVSRQVREAGAREAGGGLKQLLRAVVAGCGRGGDWRVDPLRGGL